MNAEIITIGDEILIGQIVDTNSQWLGNELNKIGVSVYQITSIQDNEKHICKALENAETQVDIVIITGGLGPTKDDITKKAISVFFNDKEKVFYPKVMYHIKDFLKKLNIPVSDEQKSQAELPSKATLLFNNYGTAPGMWFKRNNTIFVSLPGVPYEMKSIMINEVLPRLKKQFNLPFIIHQTIHTYGITESSISNIIFDIEKKIPYFIKLAYLPSPGKVRLRLSGKHNNKQILESTIDELTNKIKKLLPNNVSGIGYCGKLEKKIGILLNQRKKTICTAESMTGGKLASTIVSISGASSYYLGSFITYSKKSKKYLLGIDQNLFKKFHPVSKEICKEMAKLARKKIKSDYAISITGNAGPTTDNNDKDVGLVYIGISSKIKTEVYQFNFGEPRGMVIDKTVTKALDLLQNILLDN